MAKKKAAEAPKKMHVEMVVDRSGSMNVCRDETVSGINEYLAALRAQAGVDAKVSLSLFDSTGIGRVWNRLSPADLTFRKDQFVPGAMTPLFDAIGSAVDAAEKGAVKGELVTLVVLTDGLENASREHTKASVKALLDRKQAEGWLVIYLGANQDAFKEGGAIGTMSASTMTYDVAKTAQALRSAGEATAMFAARGDVAAAAFTDEQRKRSGK